MDCKTCNGSGETTVLPAHLSIIGVATYKTCADCEGTGKAKVAPKFLVTIEAGVYRPAALLRDMQLSYRIDGSVKSVADNMTRHGHLWRVGLGTVTAGELGFAGKHASIEEMVVEGMKEGLRLCPVESALHLAPDRSDDLPLIVASPTIPDDLGIWHMLCFMESYGDEISLTAMDIHGKWRQSAGTRIVFLMD